MVKVMLPSTVENWLTEAFSTFPLPVYMDCWESTQLQLGQLGDDVQALHLKISHPGVLRSLVLSQDPLVIIEAYFSGLFEFQGKTEDLITLMWHLVDAKLETRQAIQIAWQCLFLPFLPKQLQRQDFQDSADVHSQGRDQAAIQHHYDVGDDFYQLWLDPQRVYSCAYFEHSQMSLTEAQERKLDLICRKLKLSPGETLLDVGCGWGALLRWAVTHYGVKGYGITLSQEQLSFNQQWIAEAGLADQVEVNLLDYRDLPPHPTFDKIVSVGMIEHVGVKNYPLYFQSLLATLKPGGLFLNHGITVSGQWYPNGLSERFINRYIFPDGELANISTTLVEMEKAGWEIVDVDSWRSHYAKTLRCWVGNLETKQAEAEALVGHRLVHLWQLYLWGSALVFERNQLGIFQVLLRRKADLHWNLPLTRRGWLE